MAVPDLDQAERDRRAARATQIAAELEEVGIVAVATTFTDNAGVTRVKAVPTDRLSHLAAWGVGSTTSFDLFNADDAIAMSPDGSTPVGDLRIMPDLTRVVPLAAQPGWAWAPADRYAQSGAPHPGCTRLVLREQVGRLAERGLTMRSAFEIEWVISVGDGDDFAPATHGPAYGFQRLGEVSNYAADLLHALDDEGVAVEQFHPEYAAGQLELTVAAQDPLAAADTSVLVRETVRGVGLQHGFRTSFSPKVDLGGVGNGGHVHVSVSHDDTNLMAGGEGPYGLTTEAAAFTAGILEHLPALLALGAPSVASYLRLVPSHWAGVYATWGLENREAAVRMVTGSAGSEATAANVEIKCVDLTANPYLLLSGIIATGLAGLDARTPLPDPVDVDPAALSESELAERGIVRLPTSLADSVTAFEADEVLRDALGPHLFAAVLAVRRLEIATYEGKDDGDVAAAIRWAH